MITLPEEEGYQIRAQYELLPKEGSVMPERTSKSSESNRWDWLKKLWEEMIKFLKKIVETAKEHPYITAVVFSCCLFRSYYTSLSGAERKMPKSLSMFQGGGIAAQNAAEEGRFSCVWCHSHAQFF